MQRSDFTGPADLRAMQQLCSRVWTPSSRFHPGQLAWNRHHRPVDPDRPAEGEAISLWRTGADVVAFGWAEAPDWLELQVHPDHPEAAAEVVEWFEEWSDAESQSVLVMDGDTAVEHALADAGFAPDREAWWFTHHVLDLADLPPARVVEGCAFRHVEEGEVAARAACHVAAWSDVGPSRMTADAYAALVGAWPYRADLDWVAVDGDGAMVASCLVWSDPGTGVGLVEPVGCAPAHRGRGLAGAVTLAALHRLRELGGTTAVVSPRGDEDYPGPRRVYQGLGFRPGARTVTWTRSLG